MQDLHSTSYLPRARARSPPVRRSRSQAEPWQPRAERPGGWLNPHARKGVSTFGNTVPAAIGQRIADSGQPMAAIDSTRMPELSNTISKEVIP